MHDEKPARIIDHNTDNAKYFWVLNVWNKSGHPHIIKKSIDLSRWENLSGVLNFSLETIQPLHIGSGNFTLHNNRLYSEFYKHNNSPVIPGSSIKGVIASHLFILIGENATKKLFGSSEHTSSVLFSDALPGSFPPYFDYIQISARWDPKIEKRDYFKFYYGNKALDIPNKEFLEVVKPHTTFTFSVTFRNLLEIELGALIVAMGLDPDHRRGIKLGGGKAWKIRNHKTGLGLVKINFIPQNSWLVTSAKDLIQNNLIPVNPENLIKWSSKYWNSLNESVKNLIKEIEEKFKDEYA